MRASIIALAMALLQQGGFQQEGQVEAAPNHFRYARALSLPTDVSGQACAVLDATVYGHADTSLNAMRLYAADHEIPYVITESGEAEQAVERAKLLNVGERNGRLAFDLVMPARAYTEVDLDLAGKDYYATATVEGKRTQDGPATQLGKFALFDLSSQGLGNSTALPLQEEDFPLLHVELEVTHAPGSSSKEPFTASMIVGAHVPPTRQAQTLYTTVAETSELSKNSSVASFAVPAHVPVERVTFALEPGYTKNFVRSVGLQAKSAQAGDSPDGSEPLGEIQRVVLPAHGDAPEIHDARLSLPVETMANARSAATMEVTVNNGDDAPLPVKSVALEMRQRKICFDAQPSEHYELLYGDDAAVRAPVYDYARLFRASAAAATATLSAEAVNAAFVPRKDERPYTERHPEILWMGLIVVVAVLGGTAIHSMKVQGRHG